MRNSHGASKIARRDILAGTTGDGEELIPASLFGQLYVQMREGATSMFSLARDVVTSSGEAMTFGESCIQRKFVESSQSQYFVVFYYRAS